MSIYRDPAMEALMAAVLAGHATDEERARFAERRATSPELEAHYQHWLALWATLDVADASVSASAPPDPRILIGRAGVRALRPTSPRASFPPVSRWMLGWTAVGLLALGYFTSEWLTRRSAGSDGVTDEFVTGPRETTTARLSDGTVVRLAPDSRLRLTGQRGGRDVWLEGRGYFAVARREHEPFRIRTSAGEVDVLGTRFDLQVGQGDLKLLVVEGHVVLTAGGKRTEVEAGEMGAVLQGTALPPIKVPDVGSMVEWVGDFLAFQGTPLQTAANEIARQYGVRIEITDSALARRTITTWFMNRPLDEVLQVVCAVALARCTVNRSDVTMEPR